MSRGYAITIDEATRLLLRALGFPGGCCCGPESMCPRCMKGAHIECANAAISAWEKRITPLLSRVEGTPT